MSKFFLKRPYIFRSCAYFISIFISFGLLVHFFISNNLLNSPNAINSYKSYHEPLLFDAKENVDEAVPNSLISNEVDIAAIDIGILFCHGSASFLLQDNLRIAISSILKHTRSAVKLHIVTDEKSFAIAFSIINKILDDVKFSDQKVQATHISTTELQILAAYSAEATITKNLQKYFTSVQDVYYSDPLFFFSLFSFKIFPNLSKIILIDIDLKFAADVHELHSHFEKFDSTHLMGMAYENSVVYRHALQHYRKSHPDTKLGGPPTEGGFPGFNSGVMLIDLERLQQDERLGVLASYLTPDFLSRKSSEYSFTGSLGDQDFYTLVALDHPELFYVLPCEWNKQYCDWWWDKGYNYIYNDYFNCAHKVKVFHGNCKSKIPEDINFTH